VSKESTRFWFSAIKQSGSRTVHIISAHSIGKAQASLGDFSDEYAFTKLTWGRMNYLAGIAPPTVEQETTFAEGHLLYRHNDRTISIDIAD